VIEHNEIAEIAKLGKVARLLIVRLGKPGSLSDRFQSL
jgi:hypothetical protein